jgi:hypothetical protein
VDLGPEAGLGEQRGAAFEKLVKKADQALEKVMDQETETHLKILDGRDKLVNMAEVVLTEANRERS